MRLKDIDKFPLLPNKLDGDESEYERGYHDATANLNALPTIGPESLRPTGEWIMKETMIRSPYAKNAYCSECLEETSYSHNYCPNCGAKKEAT